MDVLLDHNLCILSYMPEGFLPMILIMALTEKYIITGQATEATNSVSKQPCNVYTKAPSRRLILNEIWLISNFLASTLY